MWGVCFSRSWEELTRSVAHKFHPLSNDMRIQTINSMSIADAEDDTGCITIKQLFPFRGLLKQLRTQATRLRLLHRFIQAQCLWSQGRMQQLPPRTPLLAIRLHQDARHIPVDLSHGDKPRSRAIIVASLLEQFHRDIGIRDDHCWPPTDPNSEDGTVNFGPLFELSPWRSFGDLEFVANERKRARAWWTAQVEDQVVNEDREDGDGQDEERGNWERVPAQEIEDRREKHDDGVAGDVVVVAGSDCDVWGRIVGEGG